MSHPEEWRRVVGYENFYSVSNLGRIRRESPAMGTWVGRIFKPRKRKDGYLVAELSVNGKKKFFPVHRLVLDAFVGCCPPGQQARHLNGIRTDARVENLAWGTAKENMQDRRKHGKDFLFEKNPNRKLNASSVRQIRELRKNGETLIRLAARFNVTFPTIHKVCAGLTWKHLS